MNRKRWTIVLAAGAVVVSGTVCAYGAGTINRIVTNPTSYFRSSQPCNFDRTGSLRAGDTGSTNDGRVWFCGNGTLYPVNQ